MTTTELMIRSWPIIVSIIGLIGTISVALYRLRRYSERLDEHEKQIREISNVDKVIASRLYGKDGESIYMPRLACDRCRTDCQKLLAEKIDDLKTVMADHGKTMKQMIRFMARVDGYLNTNGSDKK